MGTTTPFASEAVYFVVTDRFVDGDPSNNHEEQEAITLRGNCPLKVLKVRKLYMGGDLQGIFKQRRLY